MYMIVYVSTACLQRTWAQTWRRRLPGTRKLVTWQAGVRQGLLHPSGYVWRVQ